MSELTQERLKELLHYAPETGVFTWRNFRAPNAKAGDVAGSYDTKGYRRLKIDGKNCLSHRAAFLYMEGDFPPEHVDHINQITDDNRWGNLRAVTCQENMRNQKVRVNCRSGVNGVSWSKKSQKWKATINDSKKHIYLGEYAEKSDAIKARRDAEKRFGYHPNHGRTQ